MRVTKAYRGGVSEERAERQQPGQLHGRCFCGRSLPVPPLLPSSREVEIRVESYRSCLFFFILAPGGLSIVYPTSDVTISPSGPSLLLR